MHVNSCIRLRLRDNGCLQKDRQELRRHGRGTVYSTNDPAKREPYMHLRALGPHDLPQTFQLDGSRVPPRPDLQTRLLRRQRPLPGAQPAKPCSRWAARADFLGLPTDWIGKWLVAREVRFYSQVQDLPGVPRLLGQVGPLAFAHEFVPGHNLQRHEMVNDDFFPTPDAACSIRCTPAASPTSTSRSARTSSSATMPGRT